MKKVAILQSNYIPWKGYFDLIATVDEFILYDDVQYTKNDWRNRNKIITPNGIRWLTVPVKHSKLSQKIKHTKVSDKKWNISHWSKLEANYSISCYYSDISFELRSVYENIDSPFLSDINTLFIKLICKYLNIDTKITKCSDYSYQRNGKIDSLISLLKEANATEYYTGPSARAYLMENAFINNNIVLNYMNYGPYPVYKQTNNNFVHSVTILDLLFNVGIKNAKDYFRKISNN
tara:strand:- start:655 stop:1356 length:702 start_codon:yes stop_codon:yes gene_type:complete